MKGFSIPGKISEYNVGFWVIFEDCYVSVQFGAYNYCDNYRNWDPNFDTSLELEKPQCENAEVAVLRNDDGGFISAEIKALIGYEDTRSEPDLFIKCTPETFAQICAAASVWRKPEAAKE